MNTVTEDQTTESHESIFDANIQNLSICLHRESGSQLFRFDSIINDTTINDAFGQSIEVNNKSDENSDEIQMLECTICLEKIHKVDKIEKGKDSKDTFPELWTQKLNHVACMKKMFHKNIFSFSEKDLCLSNDSSKYTDSDSNNNSFITLSCGHIFHADCINQWISYDTKNESIEIDYPSSWFFSQPKIKKFSCPNCRKKIRLSEIYSHTEILKKMEKKNKICVYSFLFINLVVYFLKIILVIYLIYKGV
jgi:hypothetical protein